MIKNLLTAVIVMLAINFLAIGGGVGWMVSSHHLDKDKAIAIKAILFSPATQPTTAPAITTAATTAPAANATQRLEALLAKQSGHTPSEQMDYLRQTYEQQMAELDRREQELNDLKRQTDLAQAKLTSDRADLRYRSTTAHRQPATDRRARQR